MQINLLNQGWIHLLFLQQNLMVGYKACPQASFTN